MILLQRIQKYFKSSVESIPEITVVQPVHTRFISEFEDIDILCKLIDDILSIDLGGISESRFIKSRLQTTFINFKFIEEWVSSVTSIIAQDRYIEEQFDYFTDNRVISCSRLFTGIDGIPLNKIDSITLLLRALITLDKTLSNISDTFLLEYYLRNIKVPLIEIRELLEALLSVVCKQHG